MQVDQGSDIQRAADGLFYVTGEVNGARIRFVVDTGATVVVLTPTDARNAGLAALTSANGVKIQTVTGASAMHWARAGTVSLARHTFRQVDVAVVPSGLQVSLLGQNVLSRLGAVTLSGDHLHIR
jgi:aspartyl protease family protein